MVRKHQKSIGNYIICILLSVGIIPLILMVLSIYNTTSGLLMDRNDSSKVSATDVVQTEVSKFHKQSENVLKDVAGYPEISGGNMMKKSSRRSLIVHVMLVSTSKA